MSARVAMVTIDGNDYLAVRGRTPFRKWYTDGPVLGSRNDFPDGAVDDVRPLVVLDPEDREQVQRLHDLQYQAIDIIRDQQGGGGVSLIDAMQMALRMLVNPTPPKPPEPTGLGAVVEDVDGVRWIRTAEDPEDHYGKPWQSGPVHRHWQIVDAVKVLSEGVTA